MNGGLPTFNYQDVASPDPSLLEHLRATCHLTGFFYLRHPQLASGPLSSMFHYAREYFTLPMVEKNAIHLSHSPHYRGYSVLDEEETQGFPDHKETLDLGLEAPLLDSEVDYHVLQGPNQLSGNLIVQFLRSCTCYCCSINFNFFLNLGKQK